MEILTKNWKRMLKIIKKKKKVTETKECLWCNHELTGEWWRKNQWAWIKFDRNILNWNSKSKKNEKKRKEKQNNWTSQNCRGYLNINVQHMHNWITSRLEREKGEIFELIMTQEFPKLITKKK